MGRIKKTKIVNIILFALVVVILVCFGGFLISNSLNKMSRGEYLSDIKMLNGKITSSYPDIKNVSTKIVGNLYILYFNIGSTNFIGTNDAISKALSDNAETVNKIENDKTAIDNIYEKIKNAPDNDENTIKIQKSAIDLYNSYKDLYLLINKPSGDFKSYSALQIEKIKNYTNESASFENLLKQYIED